MSPGRELPDNTDGWDGRTRDLYRHAANPPTTQPGTAAQPPKASDTDAEAEAEADEAGAEGVRGVETRITPKEETTNPASTPRPGSFLGALMPGQVLFNKYRVIKRLGEGGMGEVWLIRHLDLDVERALKVIISAVAFDSDHRGRFRREARAMARFSHPNAVTVHDAVVRPDGNTAYIEMEYVRGQSLKDVLVPGEPMPLDWIARVVPQLCDALQVAHEHGIVHRDLKPSNLMLLDDQPEGKEHLKVLDFGIAKILGSDHADPEGLVSRTGMPLGTPLYMSPEQILADPKEVDARSDIYSLGMILYEFLTGHHAFEGSFHKLIYQHLHEAPPPFADKNPAVVVPPGVEAVVRRCLEKEPANRPQSARALAEEFLQAACPEPPPSLQEAAPPQPAWTWRRAIWSVLAAVSIGLAGAMGAWWFRPEPATATLVQVPGSRPTKDARLIKLENRLYSDKIARLIPANQPGEFPIEVVFRFIPRNRPDDPPPFYMMENKVWNELFARFARANPDSVVNNVTWQEIAQGRRTLPESEARLPAMNVTAHEAHLCATWLGGKLPRCEQWDKAAGVSDPEGRSGPFTGPWDKDQPVTEGIAVRRGEKDEGRMPVGEAARDVSLFGCRDMAGNGLEWTRNTDSPGKLIPLEPHSPDRILLRGQSYRDPNPLLFDVMKSPAWGDLEYNLHASDEIGFRVVIEIQATSPTAAGVTQR